MISIHAGSKTGFFINHSFPKTPVDLWGTGRFETDKNKDIQLPVEENSEYPYIFRWTKDKSKKYKGQKATNTPEKTTFKYAQHAFCFNFGT